MTYRLFMYKSNVLDKTSVSIQNVNIALQTSDVGFWKGNEIHKYFLKYDVLKVNQEIEDKMNHDPDNPNYKIIIKKCVDSKVEYICVVTSYENAKELITCLYGISIKYSLMLYDPQTDKCLDYSDICDEKYIDSHLRAKELKNIVYSAAKPVYRVRQLGFYDGSDKKIFDYCVTLRKDKNVSIEKRIDIFYEFLKSVINKNEVLHTDNRCFSVETANYRISFTIEAYGKMADKVCFVLSNTPTTELINRMSCEMAYKWLQNNIKLRYFKYDYCMYVEEMKELFPNPADRFVKGVYVVKQQRKEKFGIRYNDYYGGAVAFSPIINSYDRNFINCSYLMIDDVHVAPITSVISEFYPYFSKRYNEDNYLPAEMMEDVINKLKKIRSLIIADTYSEKLKPYVLKEYFYYLCRDISEEEEILFNEDFIAFLYKHRYEAVRIYDIFIEWVQTQIKIHGGYGTGLMFNMTGP